MTSKVNPAAASAFLQRLSIVVSRVKHSEISACAVGQLRGHCSVACRLGVEDSGLFCVNAHDDRAVDENEWLT